MHLLRMIGLVLMAVWCTGCAPSDSNYSGVAADDAAMNAAIAKAKETFPQFTAALRSQNIAYRDFTVKKP